MRSSVGVSPDLSGSARIAPKRRILRRVAAAAAAGGSEAQVQCEASPLPSPPPGIRGMWIHMFRHAEGRNLLPFEDDIEVSPLYYW